jgi:hypothetical protein
MYQGFAANGRCANAYPAADCELPSESPSLAGLASSTALYTTQTSGSVRDVAAERLRLDLPHTSWVDRSTLQSLSGKAVV